MLELVTYGIGCLAPSRPQMLKVVNLPDGL
jgi:hypothetical protein